MKLSSAGGAGGKGGLDKASATLLDFPATYQISVVLTDKEELALSSLGPGGR